MKILICDDEKTISSVLERLILKNFPDTMLLKTLNKPEEAFDLLNQTICLSPDLVFMDIMFGEHNGIDIGYLLQQKFPNAKLIFITGFPQYAQDVFLKVKPYGFLIKPIDEQKLVCQIENVIGSIEESDTVYEIFSNKRKVYLKEKEIYFIESTRVQLMIYCIDMKHVTYGKLDEAQTKLSNRFIRCHKSYLVNSDYIRAIEGDFFVVYPDAEIPISRSQKKESLKQYFEIKGGLLK